MPAAQPRQYSKRDSKRDSSRDSNRVLSFREWCELNGFSLRTGRRILNSGYGPKTLQLSPRRIGIRVDHNATWQDSRVRRASDAA